MATLFDKIMPGMAKKLVDQYGKSVTLIRVTKGAFDPETGAVANTETTATVKCIIEPVKVAIGEGAMMGDVKATFYAAVAVGDRVIVGDDEFRVIAANKNYSGEQIATYTAMMRK